VDEAAAKALVDELGGDRHALAVHYDLAEEDSIVRALAAVEQRWGPVDVLVANALRRGPRRAADTHMEDVAPDQWRPLVQDNLAGTLRTVQLVLPGMRERGWGRIVLVSSHVTRDGHAGQEFYAAGKSALHGFARNLAWDAGPDGVLVNTVAPGLTLTEGVRDVLPAAVRERELAHTPTGRISSMGEVAAAIVFLGSAGNGNITGEVLQVAGGR